MKQTIQALAAVSAGTLAAAKTSSSSHHGRELSTLATDASPSKQAHVLSQRSAGRKLQSACSNCHVADANGALGGPDIFNGQVCIFEQGAATSDANWNYSSALADSGVTWTEETLDQWLTDPKGFVNGTSMKFQGIEDAEERAQVIASLKEACGVEGSGTAADKDSSMETETSGASSSFSALNLSLLTAGMVAVVLGRK